MSSTVSRLRKTAAAIATSGKASPSVQVLLLTQKAEVKAVKLNTAPDGTITLSMIQALLKKKEAPEFLGSYKYKSQGLFFFGYLSGKAGQENAHELPPPHDTILAFGDIVILASKDMKQWNHPVSFTSDEYEAFYTKAFGGFDDLDDEDDDDDVEDQAEDVEEEDVAVDVVDAEEDVIDDAEESEVDDSDEESECEEDEEIVEAGVEDGEEEVIIPVVARAPARAKKTKRAANATAIGAAQVYTTYLYISEEDELRPEGFTSIDYTAQTSSPHRTKILGAIIRLFKGYLNEDECRKFERCVYVATLRVATQRHIGKTWSHPPFVEIYETVAKHIASNFHPCSYVKNLELFDRYKKGHVTFEEISQMDTYQLFEGRWHDSFEAQKVREKRQLEGNKAMATDRFICSRCRKRECTYYEMQTRSADEPMTIFITCLNCGKHWRQ